MKLATQTYGNGPRHIGLVHGLGGSGALWRSFTERLVALEDTTVTTVDLRGHGDSPRSRPYSIAGFADDVAESLPSGLDVVAGHSLGGAVLERAVARLTPARAVYFDPGFALPLPTAGWRARLFWSTAPVGLTIAALAQKRKAKGRPPLSPDDAHLSEQARSQFDSSMAVSVFRDIAFHPAPVLAPVAPSTLVLSDDSPAVVPDERVAQFESLGWSVRRIPSIGHDFWLEDADRTFAATRDLFEA